MHTFQPYPVENLEFNPFQKIGEDWAILTATDGKRTNGMTISWGGVGVLWGKNVVTVYVRESRYTKELMDATDIFSLTFFESGYKSALKYFGAVSGRDEDKFAGAHLNINHSKGVPFVDEGNFALICRKLSATELKPDDFIDGSIESQFYKDQDYHTMYIGEILQVLAR